MDTLRRYLYFIFAALMIVACGGQVTCENPVIMSTVSDPAVIEQKGSFFLFTSTDFTKFGLPIYESKDLVHWTVGGKIFPEDREYKGMRCCNAATNGNTSYVMYHSVATDEHVLFIGKPDKDSRWSSQILHLEDEDSSLFIDDGRFYIVSYNGNINLTEFSDNYSSPESSPRTVIADVETDNRLSNIKAYHIDDYYYILATEHMEDGTVREIGFRSNAIDGHYEKKVIADGNLPDWKKGTANASLIQTDKGDWYALMTSSKERQILNAGVLQPVEWSDGWLQIGHDGCMDERFDVMLKPEGETRLLIEEDDFEGSELALEWNYDPDVKDRISLGSVKGSLVLYPGEACGSILEAKSIVCQRSIWPKCQFSTIMYIGEMKPGQTAGVVAIQNGCYAVMAISIKSDGTKIHHLYKQTEDGVEVIIYDRCERNHDIVKLGLALYSDKGSAAGMYGDELNPWDESSIHNSFNVYYDRVKLRQSEDDMSGVQIGLFNYSTGNDGGRVFFDKAGIQKIDKVF